MPFVFLHNRWIWSFVILLLGMPLQAELCDSFNRCLSDQEAQAYGHAMELYESDDKQLAISLMGEMYHESSSNQLLANNYAAMLTGVGRVEEAGLVLEEYLLNESKISTATKNLFTSYLNMSLKGTNVEGQTTSLEFIDPIVTGRSSNLLSQSVLNDTVFSEQNSIDSPEQAFKDVKWQLSQFLAAWSSGVKLDYFSYFVPNQSPVSGTSYELWKQQRSARVSPSRNISVTAVDVQARESGDTVVTDFTQHYYSNNYQDTSLKQLVWTKIGDDWKILKELQR